MADESESLEDAEIERICETLRAIAAQYPLSVEEHAALKDAAIAVMAVNQGRTLQRAYRKLKDATNGGLSERTKSDMLHHGIDIESLELDDRSDGGG